MPSTALTVIHKFIRREMFDFAERLFRAGPEDVPAVRNALDKLVELLKTHAAQEDARLAPLLRDADAALAQRLERDHRRLDDQLETLRANAQSLDAKSPACDDALLQLHLDWNLYLSAYLAHLDEEERTLFARLHDRLPPVGAIVESARTQGPPGAELLLRLWAVTTCRERAAIGEAEQVLAAPLPLRTVV